METTVVYEISEYEELHRLYRMYEWWENRELEAIRRAIEQSDIVVGIRDSETDTLVAAARVITDFVYAGKVLDVIVDESYRGEGLGRQVMEAITDHSALDEGVVLTLNCRAGLVSFYEACGFREHEMTTTLPDESTEEYRLMVRS